MKSFFVLFLRYFSVQSCSRIFGLLRAISVLVLKFESSSFVLTSLCLLSFHYLTGKVKAVCMYTLTKCWLNYLQIWIKCKTTSCRKPVQCKSCSKKIAQGNCPDISPPSSQATTYQMYQAGHTNCCGLHMYQSTGSQQGWLQKSHQSNAITTMHKKMILTIKPGDKVQWWVDRSYAVHPDMHSQSGIVMTLGKGVSCSTSCKKLIRRALQRQSWWPLMMQWARYYGQGIFWQLKLWWYLQRPYLKI